jgi:ubiquinone/menaquinone biosynthesis C-methylase UbiE
MNLERQYRSDADLRIRQETHAKFTVGLPLEDLVDNALQLEPDQDLLDVGTANGAFPIRLHQAGHKGRLIGLDFSNGMIASAKSKNTNVEFIVGNAIDLPFPNHSFDVITARHMLYHVPDINKALLEIKRVLKPSGRFLALTNADGYLHDYWHVIRSVLDKNPAFQGFLEEHSNPKYFHSELVQQIKSVFGHVHLEVVDQFLEFPDITAPLAYWNSMQAGFEVPQATWVEATGQLETAFGACISSQNWQIWKGIAFMKATQN